MRSFHRTLFKFPPRERLICSAEMLENQMENVFWNSGRLESSIIPNFQNFPNSPKNPTIKEHKKSPVEEMQALQ